ncbi:MAG: amidohydrolase family protein [Gemmatimonadales bacterium]
MGSAMARRTVAVLALLAASSACAAQAQDAGQAVALVGATVIDPGVDQPIRNATVLVRSGKIQSVTAGGGTVPGDARVIDLGGRYLVPGLIDAHVHIGNFAAARRALESGVTTARSMGVGFADVGLRKLIAKGAIEGPELLAAGYHVRPQMQPQFFIDEPDMSDLMKSGVQGEEAVRRVARTMIAHGVDFIKTTATERAGLPNTDPRKPLYNERELAALVEEGARAGIPVAAHAHGDEGARAAVEAGVRSIEHGTYLSDETLSLMMKKGTYLVPTIAVVSDLTQPGGDYDNAVLNIRGRHMLPRVREMAGNAHRMGVKMVAATDTGYGPRSVLRLSHELIELVRIGMTPMEAIRSATTVAAQLLGVDDHTGRIAPGMDADLLVLERSPLDDIGTYQDVLFVMTDGRIAVDRLEWKQAPPKTE